MSVKAANAAPIRESAGEGRARDLLFRLREAMARGDYAEADRMARAADADPPGRDVLLAELRNTGALPVFALDCLLVARPARLKKPDLLLALRAARAITAAEPDNTGAHEVAILAARQAGRMKVAAAHCETCERLEPDNPKWAALSIEIARIRGDSAGAVDLLRDALDRDLACAEVYRRAMKLALPKDLAARAVAWANSVREDAHPDRRATALDLLIQYGEGELSALPPALLCPDREDGASVQVRRTNVWLRNAPPDDALRRPVIPSWGKGETLEARADGAPVTALVFTGLADRIAAPAPLFDRYPALLGWNAIYLRDGSRRMYVGGLRTLAPDFAGTVAALRSRVDAMSGGRLLAIGNSAGGYAALIYGLALGADAVLGFSAPTNLTPETAEADGRARHIARKIHKTVPPELMDIRPHVQAAAGRTAIHLTYCEQMALDRRHAQYLEGLPGVTLHPIQDSANHASIVELVDRGGLVPLLERAGRR